MDPRLFQIRHNLTVSGRELFFGVSPWIRHNRIYVVQGFGNADLQLGNLVEVVLFGGEVAAGCPVNSV